MKRFFACFLTLLLLCWAHCSMSQCGAYMDEDEANAAAGARTWVMQHPQPGHACGVCDLLTDGATLTARFAVAPVVLAELADVLMPLSDLRKADSMAAVSPAAPWHPPPMAKLCEVLSRTACPVRGPAMAVA